MTGGAADRPAPRARSPRQAALWTISSALVIAWAVVYTVWRPALWTASGPAMLPALAPGDHVLGLYLTPRLGDVVVVVAEDGVTILKRVVGVAGDTIEMREGRLFRNGRAVTGALRPARGAAATGVVCATEHLGGRRYETLRHASRFSEDSTTPVRVPRGSIYVLGDFRDRSNDSRYFGPVGHDRVLGRVVLTWWHGAPPGVACPP